MQGTTNNIEYDLRNNPRLIQFSDGSQTEYVYSALGEKLKTIHRTAVPNYKELDGDKGELANDPSTSSPPASLLMHAPANSSELVDTFKHGGMSLLTSLSIDSTEYIGNFIFENGHADKYLFPGGYYSYAVGHPSRTGGDGSGYYYYLTDHLGNNRVVVNDNGDIEQATHYYPFGAVYADAGKNPDFQKFKYTGKELDLTHGLNTYDHGARQNYSILGVWDKDDPMAEKCYNISPYAVCMDNPMVFIDPNGKIWKDIDDNEIKEQDKICVYIFYSKDFEEQAKVQYKEAVGEFGDGSVALCMTDTRDNFKNDWSVMGKNTVQVIIMTHGKNQSLTLGDKEQITSTGNSHTNLSNSEALDVSKLPTPDFNSSEVTLSLYSCHSTDYTPNEHGEGEHHQGKLTGTEQPIAEAFEERFNFKYVKGTDSSVNYHSIRDLTFPGTVEYMKPYPESGIWYYNLPKVTVYGQK